MTIRERLPGTTDTSLSETDLARGYGVVPIGPGGVGGLRLDSKINAANSPHARTIPEWIADAGLNVKGFGEIGNGASHPLSERYPTLAKAQETYPFATSLSQEIDWAAAQLALNTGVDAAKFSQVIFPGESAVYTSPLSAPGILRGMGTRRVGANIVGRGPGQTRVTNGQAGYWLTFPNAIEWGMVKGLTIYQFVGGGINFPIGHGQPVIEEVEFNGMGAAFWAINCDNLPDGIFTGNFQKLRAWSEQSGWYSGGFLNLNCLSVNCHLHNSFLTHQEKNGPINYIRNALIFTASENQFEHTGGNNKNHTFFSLDGYSFGCSFTNNYTEGTWGKLVDTSGPAGGTITNLEVRNWYAYSYEAGVLGGGMPSPILVDMRNRPFNAHISGISYLSPHTVAGGGYLFDDPFHVGDGEGVERFRNLSPAPQSGRLVGQTFTGKNHAGAVVSTYNQNETGRRHGRGIFPTNPNQGVGNASNFIIFLLTDVGPTRGNWATGTVYTFRDTVASGPNIYECRGDAAGNYVGTSGASAPAGNDPNSDVGDGVLLWRWLRADDDINKVQPGGYLLALTARTADKNNAASALYYVIYDDQSVDYTTVMQIGTLQTKGPSPPTNIFVSVTNRGRFNVSVIQGAAQDHELSYAFTKMQAL